MRVLNICRDDWANYAYDNSIALRSVGVDCIALKLNPHSFNYPNQADAVPESMIAEYIKGADVVQIFHSDITFLKYCQGKKIIVYHTGTTYRQAPEHFNKIFNPIVHKIITDQTEFMSLGGKEIEYLAPAIDTEKIIPLKEIGERLIVGHYPSNMSVKGTKDIIVMLQPFKEFFDIDINTEQIPYDKQLQRLQSCDIYVELFAQKQNGKEYGCYGTTAFEAASMGKIVVTQNIYPKVYEDAYGLCPFMICNNEYLFERTFNFLKNKNIIKGMQNVSRERMILSHSYKATGTRILKLIS